MLRVVPVSRGGGQMRIGVILPLGSHGDPPGTYPEVREYARAAEAVGLDSIWAFETHVVATEPEALLLEGRLIKEYRPRYNISFRDDKRFLLVKVSLGEEWPRVQASSNASRNEASDAAVMPSSESFIACTTAPIERAVPEEP